MAKTIVINGADYSLKKLATVIFNQEAEYEAFPYKYLGGKLRLGSEYVSLDLNANHMCLFGDYCEDESKYHTLWIDAASREVGKHFIPLSVPSGKTRVSVTSSDIPMCFVWCDSTTEASVGNGAVKVVSAETSTEAVVGERTVTVHSSADSFYLYAFNSDVSAFTEEQADSIKVKFE